MFKSKVSSLFDIVKIQNIPSLKKNMAVIILNFEQWVYHRVSEPPHDKTSKMTVCPAKTQISLGICRLIRGFAVRSIDSWRSKVSSCGQQRLGSDWADAQADPSLHWAHMPFCWFCHEVARMGFHHRLRLLKCGWNGNQCRSSLIRVYTLIRVSSVI